MRTHSAVPRRAARSAWLSLAAVLVLATACEDVTVTPVRVGDVAINPADTTLAVGDELSLTAIVRDDAGNRLNRSVAWSTEHNDVISVDATGEVVAVSSGEAQVTAAVDGRSGTATIRVADEKVATVEIDPPETRIAVGQTDRLSARARSRSGTLLEGADVVWSSDQEDIATVNAAGVVTGVAAGTTTIKATIDSVEGSAPVTVTEVIEPVVTVDVEPADTSIGVGESVTLRAIARSEDRDALGGRDVSWSSSDEGVATVDEDGSVTGESPGTATILATIEDVSGTAEVTVSILPVDRVRITPRGPSVLAGGTVQLEAVPLSAAGDPLDGRTASWQTSNDAIATVDEDGLVTGVAEGEATITATIEDVSDTTNVTVSLTPVASVEVEPADTSIFVDETVELNAIAFDADGNALQGRTASWTSSDSSVATVDSQGVVTGLAEGEATITASIEDSTATATVTVSLVPVASVEIAPADPTIFVAQTVQLEATALAENGEVLEERAVSWATGDEAVATVNADGLVTGVAAGEATITATIEDIEGNAAVTVSLVPVHSVSIEPTEATLFVDQTVTLEATPLDEDGEPLDGRGAVSWTSSNDQVATVNENGVVTGVAEDEATITATIEGIEGTATVTVSLVPVHSVSIEPTEATLFVDETVTLEATPLDEDGEPLDGRGAVSWTGSNDQVATVNANNGVVTGVAEGEATITATIEGIEGTATVTVSLVPVHSVSIEPTEASLFVDRTVALEATPLDEDGEPLDGREAVSWTSSNDQVATVNRNNGVVTGVAEGEATIRATIEGVEGTAKVEVELEPVESVSVAPSDTTLTLGQNSAVYNATLLAGDDKPLPPAGRTVAWGRTTPGDSASPCPGMTGSGNAQVAINPVPDNPTRATATVRGRPLVGASDVIIWAEAEGEVGCARLLVRPSLPL